MLPQPAMLIVIVCIFHYGIKALNEVEEKAVRVGALAHDVKNCAHLKGTHPARIYLR